MGHAPAKLHAGGAPFFHAPVPASPADFAEAAAPLPPAITITGRRALPLQERVEAAVSSTADAFATLSGWQYGLHHMGCAHMPEAELRAAQAALDAASDCLTALRSTLYGTASRVPLSAEDPA